MTRPAEGMTTLSPTLDDYARGLAQRLLEVHPEWAAYIREDPDAARALRVDVLSGVAGRTLMIRSYGAQVTVDFGPDGWHEHFGLGAESAREGYDAALAFIAELLADRVVVTTRVLFGRPLWTRAARAATLRRPRLGGMRVYSWSGALDGSRGSR